MTLQIEIQGHDMEVTASLDEYVRKKVARLERYLDALDEARVEMLHEKSARSAAASHKESSEAPRAGRGLRGAKPSSWCPCRRRTPSSRWNCSGTIASLSST